MAKSFLLAVTFMMAATTTMAEESFETSSATADTSCSLFETLVFHGSEMGRPVEDLLAIQEELGVTLNEDIPVAYFTYRFCGSAVVVKKEPLDRVQIYLNMTDPSFPKEQRDIFRTAYEGLGPCPQAEIDWINDTVEDDDKLSSQICPTSPDM
jgi:hypothetical protein